MTKVNEPKSLEIVINYNLRCRHCHRLGATESGLCLRCGRKVIQESIRQYRDRRTEIGQDSTKQGEDANLP
jgi:rRNA maturation endonuclease Nob1